MRKLLISLAVLAAVETLFMIMMIVGFQLDLEAKSDWWSYYFDKTRTWLNIAYAFSGLFGITFLPQLVIGIIVIVFAVRGMPNNKALAITSGILGILGGLTFVNAIVASISAHKERSFTSSNKQYYNQTSTSPNRNMSEVEKLRAELEAIKAENEIEKLRKEINSLRSSKTK